MSYKVFWKYKYIYVPKNKNKLYQFFTTMEVVVPLENDPILLGTLIQ